MALMRTDVSPQAMAAAASVPVPVPVPVSPAEAVPVQQDQPGSQAEASASADSNGCEQQHWPYYSGGCLKGSDAQQVRMVSMTTEADVSAAPAADDSAAVAAVAPVVTKRAAMDAAPASRARGGQRHKSSRRYAQERVRVQRPEPVYQASMDDSW
jgi:hypothetical protein